MKRTKTRIAVAFILVLILIMLCGCSEDTESKNKSTLPNIFVTVEDANYYNVVYDKETKVMYAVSCYGAGSGVFTILVNSDGTPKLWEAE